MTIVFDVGGTLRAQRCPGVSDEVRRRNYRPLRRLYNALAADGDWRVVVLTATPHTEEVVRADLRDMGLADPDELVVVRGQQDKAAELLRVCPSIIVDDDPRPLGAARAFGAYCLRPWGG